MNSPQVTVIMNPRDRFSHTEECVELLYQYSDIPFQFIFVDGNFPASIRKYIDRKSKEKDFQVIRVDRFLSPNEAKNMAIPYIRGKYSVWIDNDCQPIHHGWLGNLVKAAEETGADVVGPLVCEGWPQPHLIHFAGGENHIEKQLINGKEEKVIVMTIHRQGQKVKDVENELRRMPTELSEQHCVLVRTEWLKKLGQFDPNILGSRDHVDFCLEVTTRGGKVFFEPSSRVRFLPEPPLGPPLQAMDLAYYSLRWSDAWWTGSLDHLKKKWGVAEAGYLAKRYEDVGWRRRDFIVKPIARKLTLGRSVPVVEKLIDKWVRSWTDGLVRDYQKKATAAR